MSRMAADTTFPVKKLVNLTEDQARLISEFRFSQRLKSENEAIRTLIERGLGFSATVAENGIRPTAGRDEVRPTVGQTPDPKREPRS